jgi:hypothetical protein
MSEPQRALDPATLEELYRVFREVWREYGEKLPFDLDSEGESSLRRTLASCILRAAEAGELDLGRIKMQALRILEVQRSIHLQKQC